MKLFCLEIKRLLKTRSTRILLIAAVVCALLTAYLPMTFLTITAFDEAGNQKKLRGADALQYAKELQSEISGVITPQRARAAVEAYQACLQEYGVQYDYELPDNAYTLRIVPVSPLVRRIREAFADPDTGMVPDALELDPEEVEGFYAACVSRLNALMLMEQEDHPSAQKAAAKMYSQVSMPFVFKTGCSTNVMDYQEILMYLVLLLCSVIAAPVFSGEYQTGADSILRCARHGRVYLGVVKVAAALTVCISAFALCTAVYIAVSRALFGTACLDTSLQMLYSVSSLPALTVGEFQIRLAALGCLTLLSAVSLTLLFSARLHSGAASMALSMFFCILPVVVYMLAPDGVSAWLLSLLPASGVSLQTSYLYAMTGFEFLHAGSMSVFLPIAMAAFSALEIPIFCGSAVRAYVRHHIS